MTQAARPHLSKGSAIINTTSETTYQGSKLLLDYSSTKGAILGFTQSLSQKNPRGTMGSGVNGGCHPGPIWTLLEPSLEANPKDSRKVPKLRLGHSDGTCAPTAGNEVALVLFPHSHVRFEATRWRQVLHPIRAKHDLELIANTSGSLRSASNALSEESGGEVPRKAGC